MSYADKVFVRVKKEIQRAFLHTALWAGVGTFISISMGLAGLAKTDPHYWIVLGLVVVSFFTAIGFMYLSVWTVFKYFKHD